jgi:hydrogenase maturation protease
MKILIFGHGNPGRIDDALGVKLADSLEAMHLPGVTTDSDYQLNVEYAADLCNYDLVIFADASTTAVEPFEFTEVIPSPEIRFTSHSVGAHSLLALCHDISGHSPKSFLLAIRGYEFDFGEWLTEKAASNLQSAIEFIIEYIASKEPSR